MPVKARESHAASHLGSQHGDLGILLGRAVAVLDQPADPKQASQRPPGAALFDLATLTLGHQEHLGDVVAGYGTDVDLDLIRAWWSLRCLLGVRWLVEHGYGPPEDYPEVAVLRSRL